MLTFVVNIFIIKRNVKSARSTRDARNYCTRFRGARIGGVFFTCSNLKTNPYISYIQSRVYRVVLFSDALCTYGTRTQPIRRTRIINVSAVAVCTRPSRTSIYGVHRNSTSKNVGIPTSSPMSLKNWQRNAGPTRLRLTSPSLFFDPGNP